ncbi:MAG: GNAT family protein [Anaerolineales bacterium]|nr:MAG: GNAT family protein [Anaerolineales bacterium]
MNDIFCGKLVRLSAADPEELGRHYVGWSRDTEMMRLFGSTPARMQSARASIEYYEKELRDQPPSHFYFNIRALEDDRLLGETDLDITSWASRDAFVGIGIGDRADWGRGYGTDAMQLILRYAFAELNLHRVSLSVFEYNPRAIRSYEKCGFRIEGRRRSALLKDGKRWDMFYMGILLEEWMELNNDKGNAS